VIVRDGVIVEVGEDLTIPKGRDDRLCGEGDLAGSRRRPHAPARAGREDEETVASGTCAAAHGGFTAVCAMPNTDPVCDTGSKVRFLVERAAEQGRRVYPIGAVTKGQKGEQLAEIGDMVP